MSTLPDCLQRLRHQRLTLAVHIGAGSAGQLDGYAELSPARLVLVDGDLDASRELKAAAAGRAHIEVLAQAVSAAGQPLTWRRHNLRALNGPLSAAPLAACYPRLRELATTQVASVAIAPLIDALAPQAVPDSLLVLDVPGQELELLQAMGALRLQRFSHVIVHGLHPQAGFGPALEAAIAWLQQAHFTFEPELQPGALWGAALGRFDARALQLQTLGEQLALMQAQLAEQAARATGLEQALVLHRHEAQTRLAAAASSALDTEQGLQAELAQLRAALAEAGASRDQERHWHHENAKWAKSLDHQLKALQGSHAELATRLEATLGALEQAQQALSSTQQQRDALATALTQTREACADLQTQHAEQAQQAQQLARQVEQLQAAGAEAQAAQQLLKARLQEVANDRDAQARWHLEHAARGRQLEAQLQAAQAEGAQLGTELQALRREHAELVTSAQQLQQARAIEAQQQQDQAHQSRQLQEQLQAAAADAAGLRAQLAALQQERDGLATGTEQLRKERDTEAHWHHENANWAKALKAELDLLKPELERCRQERDAGSKESQALRQQLEKLQHELQDRDARQRLMDSEILRAEAQLDLIKEVLIREKNF